MVNATDTKEYSDIQKAQIEIAASVRKALKSGMTGGEIEKAVRDFLETDLEKSVKEALRSMTKERITETVRITLGLETLG